MYLFALKDISQIVLGCLGSFKAEPETTACVFVAYFREQDCGKGHSIGKEGKLITEDVIQ